MTSSLGKSDPSSKSGPPEGGEKEISTIPRCFVAYPSLPADRVECIETAIENIRAGGVVDIASWKDLGITGRLVIDRICDEIQNRDIFLADVT